MGEAAVRGSKAGRLISRYFNRKSLKESGGRHVLCLTVSLET
jgi:hypothetical protein